MNNLSNVVELPPYHAEVTWRLPLHYILETVAAEYDVPVALLKSPRRDGDLCTARNTFYLFGRLFGHPYIAISEAVERTNHTTAISGLETARTYFWENDNELRRYIRIATELANVCRLIGRTERATEAARPATTRSTRSKGPTPSVPATKIQP